MTRRRWIASLCAGLLTVVLGMPRLAYAVDDIFVRMTGIEGDSRESNHANWIEAFAVGNSVSSRSPEPVGGGQQPPMITFSDLSILKRIDKASPALFVKAAKGEHVQTVEVEFVRPGDPPFTYFKMELSDVLITGVRTNANSTDDSITEFVTLQYRRILWEYTPQNANGSAGEKVRGCWNLAQNVVC